MLEPGQGQHFLEGKAQEANKQLASATTELKALADMGLSYESLSEFVQSLARVSRRHSIEPEALRHRLLHDLEVLDEGLALESAFEAKRHELGVVKQAIARSQGECVVLDAALKELRKQGDSLHAAMKEDKQYVRKQIRAIAEVAREVVAKLREDAGNEVGGALLEIRKLRNAAYELGQEVGRCGGCECQPCSVQNTWAYHARQFERLDRDEPEQGPGDLFPGNIPERRHWGARALESMTACRQAIETLRCRVREQTEALATLGEMLLPGAENLRRHDQCRYLRDLKARVRQEVKDVEDRGAIYGALWTLLELSAA